ncbi:MAG TPA: hypothetical protein VIK33_10655 [Anaerolineae bacterium]
MRRSRFQRRTLLVVTNAINNLLVPLLNPIVSLLVVRWASVAVWGEFVQVLIVVQLVTHVIGWGNKDYLLREFSFNPARIARAWQTSLVSRLALSAIGGSILAVIGLPPQRALWLAVWGLAIALDQSYDVLVVYRKDFVFATLVELGGLAVQVAALALLAARIDVDGLIAVFALATLGKALVYQLRYLRQTLAGPEGRLQWIGRIDVRFFVLAFPFFLLGLSGLLQSRIDLYTVGFFLPKDQVGQYQVFTTFIIYLQSISNFVLTPFVKSLYRLTYRAILSVATRLFAFGVLLLLPGLAVIYTVLIVHYRFDLPLTFMLAGGALALPVYFYLPIIYALYKSGSQFTVVKLNLIGIAVNFAGSLLLLPRVGMIGAVIAGALAQWVMFAGYLLQSRSIRETHAVAVPELS